MGLSTVGGWVATRSSGQRSLGFERIEDLFAGGSSKHRPGHSRCRPIRPQPPDLTCASSSSARRATGHPHRGRPANRARARGRPHRRFALPSWDASIGAARELAQVRPGLSMVRASDPEAAATLALADRPGPIRALRTYATVRRLPRALRPASRWRDRRPSTGERRTQAHAIVGRHGGIALPVLGEAWRRNRFRTPYLRNALWDAGYAVDTLETATDWRALPDLADELLAAVRVGLGDRGERVHAFGHVSHVCPTGSEPLRHLSLPARRRSRGDHRALGDAQGGRIRGDARARGDDQPPPRRWDRPRTLPGRRKGRLGMATLEAIVRTFDPAGMMNPGVLLAESS